MKGKTET